MKRKILFVAACIISSPLLAQDSSRVSFLDEVVFTANKYSSKTSLTGKVLTIITKEQLERSGGKDLSQILNEQAGLIINGSNSNAGKDKTVFLRGAAGEHTLITIDGIPIYDPSGIGNNFDIRNIAIDNIERIEILKGSQSTLYGSDAIAGVINIITKKHTQQPINTAGVLSYGSNQTLRANLGLSGKKGILDYTASYTFYDTEGINETVAKTPGPTDLDGYRQNSFQAAVGIQPSSKLRIQPYLRYSKIEGDIDQGAFTDELDYTFSQKNLQAGLKNEIRIGSSQLNVLYNFNNVERIYIDDSVKSKNGFYDYSRGSYDGMEHFAEAYFVFPLSSSTKLTTGVDFRNSQSDQEYFSVSSFGPSLSKLSHDSLKQNQVGLYAAFVWNNPNGFNLEAGNRLNFHSEYGSNDVFNINPSFLINKRAKVFANLSTGYRTPSLYQLFSEYGNRNLRPEKAFTLEGGLQVFGRNEQWNARVVMFHRNVKDLIFFYFNPTTFQSQYINQDEQKDNGVELELTYNITKKTYVKAFYAYVDGEITTKQNGKDTSFYNLLRRPRNSFGINFGTQITDNLFISSNFHSIGKRNDAYFDNTLFTTVRTTLDAYVLWDVFIQYSLMNKKLNLFADLRNVTDSEYTEVSGFSTLGFTAQGGVRFKF
jgi:vitamin B12 transporter